jgi:rhodanese-related sulfurtransferase
MRWIVGWKKDLAERLAGRLVDVREYPEYAAGHIEGSVLVPLGTLDAVCNAWDREQGITLVCQSGRRAEQARQRLAALGFERVAVLPGGVQAWKAAGRPLAAVERAPWSMERQVRTVAGALVLLFVVLGVFVSRYWLTVAALVGAGLVFAGVSNTCMMASVLGRMPWNRMPPHGRSGVGAA